MNYQKEKLKTILDTVASKKKGKKPPQNPRNKFNQGGKRPVLRKIKTLKKEI